MKIAVPVTSSNQVDEHFGHCEYYQVFTITEKEITHTERLQSPQGCGCKSNIASVLQSMGVKIMLAGGIGAGAINVLNSHGIEVIRGCSGESSAIVKNYLEGKIFDNGLSCLHHEHHHGHGAE